MVIYVHSFHLIMLRIIFLWEHSTRCSVMARTILVISALQKQWVQVESTQKKCSDHITTFILS